MGNPNCCSMIIAVTFFFLQPIAEGNCELVFYYVCVAYKQMLMKQNEGNRSNLFAIFFSFPDPEQSEIN